MFFFEEEKSITASCPRESEKRGRNEKSIGCQKEIVSQRETKERSVWLSFSKRMISTDRRTVRQSEDKKKEKDRQEITFMKWEKLEREREREDLQKRCCSWFFISILLIWLSSLALSYLVLLSFWKIWNLLLLMSPEVFAQISFPLKLTCNNSLGRKSRYQLCSPPIVVTCHRLHLFFDVSKATERHRQCYYC